MHGLQACLFKYIIVAALRIYAVHGEAATKRGGLRTFIKESWKGPRTVSYSICPNFDSLLLG